MQQPPTRNRSSGFQVMAWAWLLALLPPVGVRAGDTPAPVSNTEGGSRVVALSAGDFHTCALMADGAAACWGADAFDFGQAPALRAGPYITLGAGWAYTCALKTDGSVECWGANWGGQAPATREGPYTALAVGASHTCGLKADGGAECWGNNDHGQAPATREGSYTALAAGGGHTCGLKSDGDVECWGSNQDGQAPAIRIGPYNSLAAGDRHTCGLTWAGNLDCWGNIESAQVPATRTGPYTGLATGTYYYCVLKADGVAECWGALSVGQVPTAGPYIALAAGYRHTCGLRVDGSVECRGAGGPGSNDTDDKGQSTVPADLQIGGASGFSQIAAGNAQACQVRRDGTLACWGANDEGQASAPSGLFTQVVAGDAHGCAIGGDGKAACWGREAAGNNGALDFYRWRQLAPGPNGAICGLDDYPSYARVICYRGNDSLLALGLRNITHDKDMAGRPSFCGVSNLPGNAGMGRCLTGFDASHINYFPGPWQRLESGLNHQCGLKADGSIECWGDNSLGQTSNIPAGRFRAFSVGWNHACAIRDTGTLACWGSNLNGQATPPVGTFVQVAAGNTFSCAIRGDGVRLCWGDDAHGQAPQLALSPASVAAGVLGIAHAGANLALVDAGPNADGDYVPPSPAFAVVDGALPPGLVLSSAGAVSGTPTAAGAYGFTVEGEDANGFVATRAYRVNIIADGTPPAIAYTFAPAAPDGGNGWYVGDVGLSWTLTDAESAISASTGCGPATLSTDTTGATWTCSATSAGGSVSLTTASIRRDATAPTVVAAATIPANANGWYSGDVSVHFSCSDATSGIASCPADQVLTASGASSAQEAVDHAGNRTASNVVAVNIDRSAPVIGYTFNPATPTGSNGWYTGTVVVDWTLADPQSGIAGDTGCTDFTLSTDTAGNSWTCSATNAAGLQASLTTTSIKRDATAPLLAPTAPSPLLRGGSYSASPNASDATSGVASASCGALDTGTLGSRSTTCTATDNAGNSRSMTLAYTVTTTCANDGYSGTQLTWCRNICEMGLTGSTLTMWIRRWMDRYHYQPYCLVPPPTAPA